MLPVVSGSPRQPCRRASPSSNGASASSSSNARGAVAFSLPALRPCSSTLATCSLARDLADWSARTRAGRAGDLRVGMIDAAAVHHYPDALRRFRHQRPDVELRLTVAPSASLLADLARGALDIVVCVEPPSYINDITVLRVRTDELAVYAPPSASPGVPSTWGPWVTFPAGSHTRELIDSALRRLSAPFDVVAESHQPEVLREMVALGFGWTVLPTVQAGRLRPVRPLTKRSLVLARRSAAAPNAAADILAAQLSDGPRPAPSLKRRANEDSSRLDHARSGGRC